MWIVSRILGRIGYATHGEKGRKIGRKAPWMFLLAFAAYSVVEYVYVYYRIQYLCKREAGVFVYVTPEKWNEENKNDLKYIDNYENKKQFELIKMKNQMSLLIIDGVTYKPWEIKNSRITHYTHSNYGRNQKLINRNSDILLDNKNGKVLIKSVSFHAIRAGSLHSGFNSYRIWMNNIPSCRIWKSDNIISFSEASNNFLSIIKE